MAIPVLEEEWRPILGWEDKYWVSNLGKIKGRKGILREWVGEKGYRTVSLEKGKKGVDRISKHMLVHRAVALAFIPNPDNLPVVNHIDGNPNNNRADNLEWCTYKYNSNYGDCKLKISIGRKKAWENEPQSHREQSRLNGAKTTSKPVIQLTKEGEFVKEYPNIKTAARATGVNDSHISAVASGSKIRRTAGGFKWVFSKGGVL